MDISSPENMKYAAGEMFKTLAGGYSPPPVYGGNYQFLPGVPPFTIYAVDAMLHDYQVKLALQMLYVPVMKPQFALVGDPEICQFVEETMRKIWTGHIIDISQAMPYTRFGAETLYKKDPKDNRAKFHKMMPFHPRDFRIITRDREIAGLKIVNTWNDFTQNAESGPKNGMTDAAGFYIMAPKSFVYVHERRHGSFQGRSVLEGSYEPWLEKSQEGGAISSRSMWFYRSAFDGGVLWYPPGESIDEFGNKIPNADVAMKILESVRNGNAIAMENVTDDRGNPSWRYEKAQVTQGGDVILKYIDHLDHKIILGAGLPDDVISQNSGTGSYAGRTIPFIAFLESGTPTVRAITNCIKDQLIQPLIVWNFGHERGNDWDITEAKVNVDQFLGGQGADAGKGVAGDGDGDGVPNEAGMPGGGNGMPKNGPKQMSIAQVEELLERNYVETTGTNRKIFKNLGRLMGQSPEVSFVYEGRNRTSKIIGLPIQMSHDVSDEKRASDGKWTKDGSSAEQTVNEMIKPHVTETPAFKKWFGDSKVVDDDGKPLVVYHGTNAIDFNSFRPDESGRFGRQFYHMFDTTPEYPGAISKRIYPAYLAINNPLISDSISGHDLSMRLKSEFVNQGYDGVRTKEGYWVAFHPNQIKSAISNKGSFDPNDPRINMSQWSAGDFIDFGQKMFAWDESEHPRDHGKFAEKPGAKAEPKRQNTKTSRVSKPQVPLNFNPETKHPHEPLPPTDVKQLAKDPKGAEHRAYLMAKRFGTFDDFSSDKRGAPGRLFRDAAKGELNFFKKPVNFRLAMVPVSQLHPSQEGEDYNNSSSEYTGSVFRDLTTGKQSVADEDLRLEDLNPILIDSSGQILDGNHRHAAHRMNGNETILAMIPVEYGTGEIVNLREFYDAAKGNGDFPRESLSKSNSSENETNIESAKDNQNDLDRRESKTRRKTNKAVRQKYDHVGQMPVPKIADDELGAEKRLAIIPRAWPTWRDFSSESPNSPVSLYKEAIKEAQDHVGSNLNYKLTLVSTDEVTPYQTSEFYVNENSKKTAELYKRVVGPSLVLNSRRTDFNPIVTDENGNLIDGHHRHAASRMNGNKHIFALVPDGEGNGTITNLRQFYNDLAAKKPIPYHSFSEIKPKQFSQSDSDLSGHWITIGGHGEGKESHGGTKVFIGRNGKILKGPAALKGENVGHIGKQKPLSEKEQQQIDHEKRLQSAGRLGKYTLHSSHDKELAKLKNDRQERVLTEAEKDRLIALDVSRHHDPHEVKQQGFRPEIVKHAAEVHKKARKTGELASKPIDHASTREGIDARRAHAKAAGKSGHHYTEAEARKLGSKEHIEAHGHAKQIAKELGISTHDVLQNMESAHKYLKGEHEKIESAKATARRLTGLNAGNLAKIENAGGRDYSTVPGFDTAARSVAMEHKELNLDPDDPGTPAAVWDLIREGKVAEPKLHDRQTAHLAGQWIAEASKRKLAKSDHDPDEDTSFNFGFGKSDSNDDWGGDSGFDSMDFGLGILDE